jgi:hypothetical protein
LPGLDHPGQTSPKLPFHASAHPAATLRSPTCHRCHPMRRPRYTRRASSAVHRLPSLARAPLPRQRCLCVPCQPQPSLVCPPAPRLQYHLVARPVCQACPALPWPISTALPTACHYCRSFPGQPRPTPRLLAATATPCRSPPLHAMGPLCRPSRSASAVPCRFYRAEAVLSRPTLPRRALTVPSLARPSLSANPAHFSPTVTHHAVRALP